MRDRLAGCAQMIPKDTTEDIAETHPSLVAHQPLCSSIDLVRALESNANAECWVIFVQDGKP